jgi:rhodanese-related sulfurtransferase
MKNIQTAELASVLRSNRPLALVDVLPENAYEENHIPRAMNIPVRSNDFVEQATAKLDMATPVVVYCADSACDASEKAARKLESAGFQEVYEYAPGIEGWKTAGLPLVSAPPANKA